MWRQSGESGELREAMEAPPPFPMPFSMHLFWLYLSITYPWSSKENVSLSSVCCSGKLIDPKSRLLESLVYSQWVRNPADNPDLKFGILKWGEKRLPCGTETLTCGLWSCLWVGKSQNWAELEHLSAAYTSSIYLLLYENCLAVWEKEPTHCNGVQDHKGPMIRYNLVGINNNNKMSASSNHGETSLLFQYLIYSIVLCLFVWFHCVCFRTMKEFSQATRALLSK